LFQRTTAIFLASYREVARSPLAWLGALALLMAVPVATLFGESGARVWLSRSLVSEGLRWLLPLAALIGAAYVIRPSLKRCWVALPARRAEYFCAAALTSFSLMLVCATLVITGGALTGAMLGDEARLDDVRTPRVLHAVSGSRAISASAEERLFARPNGREQLVFEFEGQALGDTIDGKMQFEIAWTTSAAPSRGAPFELKLVGEREVIASTTVEARRRVTFRAPNPGGQVIRVIALPNDPALSVGMKRDECRLVLARASSAPSLAWLAFVAACGALLCAGVTLAVRSLATAPTAALAGALVFAAMTLLPALGPGDFAARQRRADVENIRAEVSRVQALGEFLAQWIPPLNEPRNFERVLLGEAAQLDDAPEALWRLGIALALLPLGAALFSRRQIA
jgi:hypothetical protein